VSGKRTRAGMWLLAAWLTLAAAAVALVRYLATTFTVYSDQATGQSWTVAQAHALCSSAPGTFAQSVSSAAAASCHTAGLAWDGCQAAAVFAACLAVAAVLAAAAALTRPTSLHTTKSGENSEDHP
jgi:hypothetical protein